MKLDCPNEMILTRTHNLFLSKHNEFSCKRDSFICVSMKKMKQQQKQTKHEYSNKKHDPQVGNFFEFLGRVYASPVILSWKESLEGGFVSKMFP